MNKLKYYIILLYLALFGSISAFGSSDDFHKKILVEEFTGEGCVNCPRVAGYIHTSIQKEEYANDVIVICHHSGYRTDWLTTDFDREYTWFYNASSTFAPGMMIDRYAGDATSPVYAINNPGMMEELWNNALAEPAPLSVEISAENDKEAKKVRIRVCGDIDPTHSIPNPVITIYLVEDEIEAIDQVGAGEDYVHEHVGRAVNAAWGEPIDLLGKTYSYDCEIDMSPRWDAANMYVVACVSNYNADDPTDCKVANTSSLRFNDFTGLASVATLEEEEAHGDVYNLQGMKMNAESLAPGIYIRNGKKFVVTHN